MGKNSFPGLLLYLFVLKSVKYNFLDMHRLKRIRFNCLVLSVNGRFALLNLYI